MQELGISLESLKDCCSTTTHFIEKLHIALYIIIMEDDR